MKPFTNGGAAALEFGNFYEFISFHLGHDGHAHVKIGMDDRLRDDTIKPKHLRRVAKALLELAESAEPKPRPGDWVTGRSGNKVVYGTLVTLDAYGDRDPWALPGEAALQKENGVIDFADAETVRKVKKPKVTYYRRELGAGDRLFDAFYRLQENRLDVWVGRWSAQGAFIPRDAEAQQFGFTPIRRRDLPQEAQ